MKIVKLTTDLIELRTNSGIVFESFTSCITTARIICMGATVQIYVEGRYINIEASEVTATQVLPAAEVPFPALGTASDLLALLNADFFEVCGAQNSFYEVEEEFYVENIAALQLVYTYQMTEGEYVGISVEAASYRSTIGFGASASTRTVSAGMLSGTVTLNTPNISPVSRNITVNVTFVVNGTTIEIYAPGNAQLITTRGIIRIIKV